MRWLRIDPNRREWPSLEIFGSLLSLLLLLSADLVVLLGGISSFDTILYILSAKYCWALGIVGNKTEKVGVLIHGI